MPQQTEVAPAHPPTDVLPQHPPTEAVPQHPPTDVLPQQRATIPPRQQVTDVAARQPEAGAGQQPAAVVAPRQPEPEAVARETMTYLPPRQPPADATPPPPYAPQPSPDAALPPYPPQPSPDAPPPSYAPQPSPDAPPPPYAPQPSPDAPPPPSEVLRYGPGVPASPAGAAAESVWRTGRRPEPPPRQRRLRRLLGLALTLILLVAAGAVLYLRFFDHAPFHVTGAQIVRQAKNGCAVDVTGRIDTNGSAGTVSYQWVFRPQTQAPRPLNQSVLAGQHAVYVTVAVEGQGHGSASQMVTLDVLGPDTATDSTNVTITC